LGLVIRHVFLHVTIVPNFRYVRQKHTYFYSGYSIKLPFLVGI